MKAHKRGSYANSPGSAHEPDLSMQAYYAGVLARWIEAEHDAGLPPAEEPAVGRPLLAGGLTNTP